MDRIFQLFLLLLPIAAPKGSHSLWFFATYIKGQKLFPELSSVTVLDDIRVLYYNGDTKTFIPRGNTTAEDDVFDLNDILTLSKHINMSFIDRWTLSKSHLYVIDGVFALQMLVVCELMDDGEQGPMIIRNAFRGSTTDELLYVDKKFTYQNTLNISDEMLNANLQQAKQLNEELYQPFCFKTLKRYLEKRKDQISRKDKPKVRLLQKELESGFHLSCLATGFYPRHLNLSLFRDGQPVSDHEITGGDLLPNGDGTYQMRKSLEIRGEERDKHTYSCSITHLSLDNKLTVELELDHGVLLKVLIPSVLTVLVLVLVCAICSVVLYKLKKRRTASSDYTTSYKTEECEQLEATEMSETPLN